ncbi:MAG TPA: PEP-CTERM sorting domain-containing protein [Lacipirellulaceae bacterium]|nr:PEP-CTERM sorting domain-containing protein [Lacipirellulaceae bacterium]
MIGTIFKRILAIAAMLACNVSVASATTPSNFYQGFETDVAGWDVFGPSYTPTRVSSGTNGIPSASGSYHAELDPGSLASPTDAATDFGGYTDMFPAGGYTTSLEIYLDPAMISADDTRFNYISAVSKTDGSHLRDFAFVVGGYTSSDLTGPGAGTDRFIVNGQTNSGRSSSYPKDPSKSPVAVSTAGWYTFEHVFSDNAGVLSVDLNLYDPGNSLVSTWTLSDPSDLIPSVVGGNRYGWVYANEFNALAIDNSSLTTAVPEPTSVALLGLAAAGIGMCVTRRRR